MKKKYLAYNTKIRKKPMDILPWHLGKIRFQTMMGLYRKRSIIVRQNSFTTSTGWFSKLELYTN